jgi:hypothetical protein
LAKKSKKRYLDLLEEKKPPAGTEGNQIKSNFLFRCRIELRSTPLNPRYWLCWIRDTSPNPGSIRGSDPQKRHPSECTGHHSDLTAIESARWG